MKKLKTTTPDKKISETVREITVAEIAAVSGGLKPSIGNARGIIIVGG